MVVAATAARGASVDLAIPIISFFSFSTWQFTFVIFMPHTHVFIIRQGGLTSNKYD